MAGIDGTEIPKAEWSVKRIRAFNAEVFAVIKAARDAEDQGETERADLSGVVFPGWIGFGVEDVDQPLPSILFLAAEFSNGADFQGATFSGIADFEGATFSDLTFFAQTIFSRPAHFTRVTFSDRADFRKAAFSKDVYFTRAAFLGVADFSGAIFSNDTEPGRADFSRATFSRSADISQAKFFGRADFSRTTFSGRADFSRAAFKLDADFSGVAEEFGVPERRYALEWTSAPGAERGSVAGVGVAIQQAHPSASIFRQVDFAGAKFGADVNFNNRRFTDTANFRDAVFMKAPKFHNAVLHQETDFTGARFEDFASDAAARSYRTLKLAMEQARARRQESMFFAYEQRSLRNLPDMSWPARLASELYDWAAAYGESFVRPLRRIGEVFIVFFLIYCGSIGSFSVPPDPPVGNVIDILTFTGEQIFRPFEIWGSRYQFAEAFKGLGIIRPPLVLKLLATAQSLVTYGLFTLFLLALRKRFRMI